MPGRLNPKWPPPRTQGFAFDALLSVCGMIGFCEGALVRSGKCQTLLVKGQIGPQLLLEKRCLSLPKEALLHPWVQTARQRVAEEIQPPAQSSHRWSLCTTAAQGRASASS